VIVGRLLTLAWAGLLVAAPAFGQQDGQSGFVPYTGPAPAEQLPAAPLLIAAYAFVWVAAMAYLWSIWRRLDKVETDIHALEKRRQRGGER
jgi:hypothetical protein